MAPLDSLMNLLAHRAISVAIGASCTSFLPALKSVCATRNGTGRGHRWPGTLLALPALCHASRIHARTASTAPPATRAALASRAKAACHLPPRCPRPQPLLASATLLPADQTAASGGARNYVQGGRPSGIILRGGQPKEPTCKN